MNRRLLSAAAILFAAMLLLAVRAIAADVPAVVEKPALPYVTLTLARDPAVHEELKLTGRQIAALQKAVDAVDGPFWVLRDVPVEKCRKQLDALHDPLRRQIVDTLTAAQRARFDEITLQARGFKSLASSDVAASLKLSAEQTAAIARLLADAQPVSGGSENGATTAGATRTGASRTAAAKSSPQTESRAPTSQDVLDLLEPEQRAQLNQMAGPTFDFSRLKRIGCQAPELRELDGWINSEPTSFAALRGKVVAVHFWAFGCINCVHNLPLYQAWFEKFPESKFAIIGIHTPETEVERNVANLRQNVRRRGIAYPVAVDGAAANWAAWGNQMWPACISSTSRGASATGGTAS